MMYHYLRFVDLLAKTLFVLHYYPSVIIWQPRRLVRGLRLLFSYGMFVAFQDAYDFLTSVSARTVRDHSTLLLPRVSYPKSDIPIIFSQEDCPLVSIIICCRNHWEYTETCLRAIHQHTYAVSYELIIVDDGSDDDPALRVQAVRHAIHIRHEQSLGYLLSAREGAQHARGTFLVFLNNDTVPQADWLRPLVQVLESDPDAVIAGPLLLSPNGHIQEAGARILPDGWTAQHGRGDLPLASEYQNVRQVDYVSGAALCVRRTFWEEVGGYDIRFTPAYYEDTDLALQALTLDKRVLYQPRSRVVHSEHASYGDSGDYAVRFHVRQRRPLFLAKWRQILPSLKTEKHIHRFGNEARRSAPVVVVLDRFIPRPSEDAGSRCTFHYLTLLASIGCTVVFIPQTDTGLDSISPAIQEIGIELVHRGNARAWAALYGKGVDVVLCFRTSVMADLGEELRLHIPAPFFLVITDIASLREERKIAFLATDPTVSSLSFRIEEDAVCPRVSGIFTHSTLEKSIIEERYPHVPVALLPIFIGNVTASTTMKRAPVVLFVGGFLHEPNRDALTWIVDELFPDLHSMLPEAHLVVAGSFIPLEYVERAPGIHFVHFPDERALDNLYHSATAVIAPLRFGAGVKGKISDALIHGVPVVTTTVGAEGFCGTAPFLIADTRDEFVSSIVRLCTDLRLLETMRHQSCEYAETYFSPRSAISALRELIPCIPDPTHHSLRVIVNQREDRSLIHGPLISVIMPAWRSTALFLQEALQSLRNQEYQQWELCIATSELDDEAREALQRMAYADTRIRIIPLTSNLGISGNTNAALSHARGSYVAFMDHDDLLYPHALAECARTIIRTGADIVYSDESIIYEDGTLKQFAYKPDWSPEAFLSANYFGHLVCMSLSCVHATGCLSIQHDGAQDFDFLLRATRLTKSIEHIPLVLYAWRAHKLSTSYSVSVKPYVSSAIIAAVSDELTRRGKYAEVHLHSAETCRVRIHYHMVTQPQIDVIVPSCNAQMLSECLSRIYDFNQHDHLYVTVINHGAREDITRTCATFPHNMVRELQVDRPFNFSLFCNQGAQGGKGDTILFLNDDAWGMEHNWITVLAEHFESSEHIGVVGARLWYPNGYLQEYGIVMGLGPRHIAYNAYRCMSKADIDAEHLPNIPREFLAVTGACLMTRRDHWKKIHGFDSALPVAYNDVDFCLRLRRVGYSVLATPYVNLIHHESSSRPFGASPESTILMYRRWRRYCEYDPYLTPDAIRLGPFDDL